MVMNTPPSTLLKDSCTNAFSMVERVFDEDFDQAWQVEDKEEPLREKMIQRISIEEATWSLKGDTLE